MPQIGIRYIIFKMEIEFQFQFNQQHLQIVWYGPYKLLAKSGVKYNL